MRNYTIGVKPIAGSRLTDRQRPGCVLRMVTYATWRSLEKKGGGNRCHRPRKSTMVIPLLPARSAAFTTGASFAHTQGSAVHLCSVKSFDRGCCGCIIHFHKSKTPGSSRLTVAQDINIVHGAVCLKNASEFLLGCAVGQVANIDSLRHLVPLPYHPPDLFFHR